MPRDPDGVRAADDRPLALQHIAADSSISGRWAIACGERAQHPGLYLTRI